VRNALLRSRLPPHLLELDLTEGVFVDDAGSVITLLQQLRELGVQLTIDDFGTGYSSLSYLRRLPVDVLKIDQSFLRNVTSDPDAATILKAVIDIGLGLQQQVIAEGVETEEQFRYLQRNNCRDGQGYFFSLPVPAEAFTRLLAQHDTAPT
jgi:EAL domain-containing protein (putative c-di-GMP-specific phosphodiesterase class I)